MAVLASGPTLNLFQGFSMPSIAVNAASLSGYQYDYFMCGDMKAPLMPYFKKSISCHPVRIIASFLAPLDQALYPDPKRRKELRVALAQHTKEAREKVSMEPLYRYFPLEVPQKPHAFFQYHTDDFPEDCDTFLKGLKDEKFFHGGTITGVALQMAWWMGSKEIHLFGCSMNNFDGTTYGVKTTSVGKTTQLQVRNLKSLIRILNALGTAVNIHGPSILKEGNE